MTTGGRTAACPSRISAGPAAASATPACSTVRRPINLSLAVGWLAISSSMRFWTRALQVTEDCRLPLAPVKGTGTCARRQRFTPDHRKYLARPHCPRSVGGVNDRFGASLSLPARFCEGPDSTAGADESHHQV